MAEIDTSSYPKPAAFPAQKSALEQAGQYQTLESQGITISKQKLDLLNDQFKIMNAELSTLADPEANGGKGYTKAEAAQRLTTIAKTLGFKPEVSNHMMQELQAAPDVKSFARNSIVRGQSEANKINRLYGDPGYAGNGQTQTPVVTSPMLNGGVPRPVGMPIQQQIPPGVPVVDENNQPRFQGPTPAVTPPGTVSVPTPLSLPVARNPSAANNQGMTTTSPNAVVENRGYPAPSGPAAGTTPLFEEGKKAYTAAQQNAATKMLAAKPAIQALPLMQTAGFLTGPGSEGFTKVAAALKTWGLIDTAAENDPTAVRQEVAKKLAQYVSNSPVGQRSDAAQTLKEASSPNPKVQILPALMQLTKDAIALDRIEAALPNSFKDKDYSKFISHQGKFPQSVDEKAFTLDLEPEEKSKKLVDDMAKKLQSNNNRDVLQAEKFFKSLRIAKENGFYQ